MDTFDNKIRHLADMARASVADAAELNEISEVLRNELVYRGAQITSLRDELAQRQEQSVSDTTRAFWLGSIVGFVFASACVAISYFTA